MPNFSDRIETTIPFYSKDKAFSDDLTVVWEWESSEEDGRPVVDNVEVHYINDIPAYYFTKEFVNEVERTIYEGSAVEDFNFAHDIMGIHRHIDRNTGVLTECFSPRFTDYKKEGGA
jgi:hypothetical protein